LKTAVSVKALALGKLACCCLLLVLLYHSALVYLYGQWSNEDFTYCFMVPPVALYLVLEKRRQLAGLAAAPSWGGLVPLGLGIVFFWLGELGGEFTLQFLSLWLVLVALCWLQLGWRKLRIVAFPLFFSLAMFVPPHALYDPLTMRMKLISSQFSVQLMQLYGLSAYREGNVIDLGFTKLQVVDACSGLRYVIPLFLMGLLLAYYYRAAFWKRALLVLSTLPLSILTNSLRIASVGVLYQFMGAAAAEGFFHEFSGWFIFMAGLGSLLLEVWLLKKVLPDADRDQGPPPGENARSAGPIPAELSAGGPAGFGDSGWPAPPQFFAALAVLGLTLALCAGTDLRQKTPLARPFADFPLSIGQWSGSRSALEQQFLDALTLSDYALVNYRNPQGEGVGLYVAYNASQSKGEATHSPATCLPSSGWVLQESGTAQISGAAKGEGTTPVCRAFMEKNGVRQLVYYWFPQRGRILTSLYQVKYYNFWDALTKRRTDGALVRVITPIYGSESVAAADRRLQDFSGQAGAVLRTFLPQ
jgi:exosortase D (VPLPA-CTERM-specific)